MKLQIILILAMLSLSCFSSRKTTSTNYENKQTPTPNVSVNSMPVEQNLAGEEDIAPSTDNFSVALTLLRNNKESNANLSDIFSEQDGVRLNISFVENGFLTIIFKGSSGKISTILPSKDYLNGKNGIEANQNLVIPNKGWLFFDDKRGIETFFIVYSKSDTTKEYSVNPKQSVLTFEKLCVENNNSDSFMTKDGELVRVIELQHE